MKWLKYKNRYVNLNGISEIKITPREMVFYGEGEQWTSLSIKVKETKNLENTINHIIRSPLSSVVYEFYEGEEGQWFIKQP